VFAVGLPDGTFVFGRVIAADLPSEQAPMPGSNLVYIYDLRTASPEPRVDELTVERLLIPPLFINRLPWSRGYFQTVSSADLDPSDRLPQHHFWDAARSAYVNEAGRPIAHTPPTPVGDWGLHSFRTVDDAISEALGFPPVPEDE
jgi:hypothetical protein